MNWILIFENNLLDYTYSSDEEESEAVNSCMYLKKYQEMVHHVTSNKSVLWPGKDYYNMMIKDFYDLRNPFSGISLKFSLINLS